MDKEKIVKAINTIIVNAVWHGADPSGSYSQNEKTLVQAVKDALELFDLKEYKIIMCDGLGGNTPIIVKNENTNEYKIEINYFDGYCKAVIVNKGK